MINCGFCDPNGSSCQKKEEKKTDKYMDLSAEVRRLIRLKIVIVPIVLRTLETVPAKLSELLEQLDIEHIIGSLQTDVLISTKAILRTVLNI